MSTDPELRETVECLKRPISDLATLLVLLSRPLDGLGLLPPQYSRFKKPFNTKAFNVAKHIPPLQHALLSYVAPTWDDLLAREGASALLDQYFCPDGFSSTSPIARDIVILAYSTILSHPLTQYTIQLLERISTQYPLDSLYPAFFDHKNLEPSRQMVEWEDYVRNIAMVPGKVANSMAGKAAVPSPLEHATYFNNICLHCESLIFALSQGDCKGVFFSVRVNCTLSFRHYFAPDAVPSVAYLVAKLVNLGVFPSVIPVSRSQPSFFQITLHTVRGRLEGERSINYSNFWSSLVLGLPTDSALRSVLTSLFSSLSVQNLAADPSQQRPLVKRESYLLNKIVGDLIPQKEELWESVLAIISGGRWDVGHARIFVCWVSGGSCGGQVNEQGQTFRSVVALVASNMQSAIGAFLDNLLETWTSPNHIKHSLLSHHQCAWVQRKRLSSDGSCIR